MRGRVRFKLGLGLDGRRDVIDDDVDDPGVDLFAFNSVLTDETSRRRRYLPSMVRMMPKGAQRRPRKWAVAAVGLEGGGLPGWREGRMPQKSYHLHHLSALSMVKRRQLRHGSGLSMSAAMRLVCVHKRTVSLC